MDNTKFESVCYAIDKLNNLFIQLDKNGIDSLTIDEQIVILNPMGYLAGAFYRDGFWGEDLMYALEAIYRPPSITDQQ